MRYTNVGPAFPRDAGGRVERGEIFEPTERERRVWGFQLQAVKPEPKVLPVASGTHAEWPMQMSPEKYLKIAPNGDHAALARALTGALLPEAEQPV